MSRNVLSNNNTPEENLEYLRSVLVPKGTQRISWEKSIGRTIEYEYEWYGGSAHKGSLTISRYEGQRVCFEGIEKSIFTGELQKCQLGGILNLKTSDFKFKVGDIINGLLIINKEHRTIKGKKYKFYKYRCKCTNEDWIREGDLNQGQGCNVCCPAPRKAVLGRNTVWDKARWMVDLGVSEEDAKKYMPQSNQKIEVTCPYCGRKRKCKISNIYKNHSIGCNACGDGVSYPEKFMYSVLSQLNIKFETQYSPKWCKDKQRYDFYLSDYNTIIETHGIQHYRYTGRGRSLEEEQENDRIKEELALNNGITNYIVIDCRNSEIDWIKEQILNSELAELFDLSIDWNKCEKFACSNLVKVVCDYWREHKEINGENITTKDIGEVFGLSSTTTVVKYLKQGVKLGWCNYDPKEEQKKNAKANGKVNGGQNNQPIYCPELNRIFTSIRDVEKELKINHSNISCVLNGKRKTSGKLPNGTRLTWQYVDKNSNYYKNYLKQKKVA